MERITYQGLENNYRLSNGIVELIAMADFGPRIIHFGFVGQPNEFQVYPVHFQSFYKNRFWLYGGHRLWHAPEVEGRTNYPDNSPVDVVALSDGGMRLSPTVPSQIGIQKELDVYLAPNRAQVRVVHRFYNRNVWDVELSLWALTVMPKDGKGVFPLPARQKQLLPNTVLSIWGYTDMSDPRWTWGKNYILLQQAYGNDQKVGWLNPHGWLAYIRNGHAFIKTFTPVPNATYPDFGVNCESFTDEDMLELETLSPLIKLAPGAMAEHIEEWHLFENVPTPQNDADVIAHILPLVPTH
jgi:hypothetical protein